MTNRISKKTMQPKLRGDAFLADYKTGNAARFLYDAVKSLQPKPAAFSKVECALGKLADRIAWRLVMATDRPSGSLGTNKVVPMANYPDLHMIEITELLALVFEDAPIDTYAADAPAATFWNWWDWAAGGRVANDPVANRMTDLPKEERLAAGAAAIAVLNARAAITLAS